MTKIGLGTVQFGIPYGITNSGGRVPLDEVRAILDRAAAAGVATLDTAALYGESEAVLGQALRPDAPFEIVTKTAKFADVTDPATARTRLNDTFSASLAALKREHVYGLLAHEADDLLGPAGETIWQAMQAHKRAGRVTKIGASVYTGRQIDALMARYDLDLVQLPINALDDRLIRDGQLARLHARGVEVHARSLFLQGLLLQAPDAIEPRFAPLPERVRALHAVFAAAGLSPLEGALAAIMRRPEISRTVVGVTSTREWDAIIVASENAGRFRGDLDLTRLAIDDERILSPARWHELKT
ncbi:MAG: aldo/keto reductase [Hyphomicrobiaceae bacterium]|nr:aldo/keto reductase [Hyphomicrobiaceae bacterium]